MRALILSDIHGNLEALEAVLAAAEGQWDELWNLGDTVGYGASPNQVVECMRSLGTVHVRGNHDRVCCGLTSPEGFNPIAKSAALWTRKQLTPDNLAWIQAMPQGPVTAGNGTVTCVHGSPLDEDDYLLSVRDAMAPVQSMRTAITFFGHTHVQGGFSYARNQWHELTPQFGAIETRRGHLPMEAQSQQIVLEQGSKALVNPGSVGQPRDHDWRAAFAIFDSAANAITFHRVAYDLATSQAKIFKARLPERLASRLREGR
jgi:predicted phosphodiesterase